MRRIFSLAFLFGVLLTLLSGAAHAQLSTATVFGNITDATGAAVPNADILLNAATCVAFNTMPLRSERKARWSMTTWRRC